MAVACKIPEFPTKESLMDRPDLLQAREKTHGDFEQNAVLCQNLRTFLRQNEGWSKLNPIQKQCLEEILLKIARIASGMPYVQEHWDDIRGYCDLAIENIRAWGKKP